MHLYLTELVRYLATQSWQIAILALAVAFATWALRHKTAHVRYLLWLIVLAKCLVPPFFAVPLKVLPEKALQAILVEPSPVESMIVQPERIGQADFMSPSLPNGERPPDPTAQRATPSVAHRVSESMDVRTVVGMFWIVGAGLYLAMNLLRAVRGRCWLHSRRRPLPDEIRRQMEPLLSVRGERSRPGIWMIDEIGQPFVWGLLRGSIYVPSRFLEAGDPDRHRHVLAHELSHVLRFDAAVNGLQTLAQGLFWFHPLVWWANREIRREREKCCDEMAVAQLGAEARDYCHAVVETLASAETSARPVPSLAVAGSARNLEERIRTMLRPGKRFYRRPTGPTALVVLLMAILTAPTAVVLTVRAQGGQTAEDKTALNEVVAAYEASRDAASRRYLLVVKNDFKVHVTYRDGAKLHKATYDIGSPEFGKPVDMEAIAKDRRIVGDTMESILGWTQRHLASSVQVYDGTAACNVWPDGHNRFEGGRKTTYPPPEVSTHPPTLRGLGWPLLGGRKSMRELISTDRYALDHDLICIEEQYEVIRNGREKVLQTTRFYLNPRRDYLCERKHEASYDYAEQITKYAQIEGRQWYPLQISEFGYKHQGRPMTREPSQINMVYLDTDPTFPEDIFSPDALIARYGDLLVAPQPEIPSSTAPEDDSAVRVAGRVLDGATREPIASALVRVAAPAMNMRDIRVPTGQMVHETRTAADGTFDLSVPITEEMDDISVDAIASGYNTAAGTFRGGGDDPMLARLPLSKSWRNQRSNLTILLSKGLCVAGTVKDDQGEPAPGITVFASMRTDRFSGGIAKTQTDDRGRFEIFDYPLQKQLDERAVLSFTSATTLPQDVTGLYDMTDEQRRSLEVTVHSGRKITGVVQNADGRPAAGVAVEAVKDRMLVLRETAADRDGRFELAGLSEGPLAVRAYDLPNDQRARMPITLGDRNQEITVRMQPIELAQPFEPVPLLGMRVIDVTKEIQEAYDLFDSEGVMIWDPGADSERLGIGELKKGYRFWVVGDKRISNVRDMVAEILQAQLTPWQDDQPHFRDPPQRVRIVCHTRRLSNTQYLALTQADVDELRTVAGKLGLAGFGAVPTTWALTGRPAAGSPEGDINAKIAQLQPGVSTRQDAIRILGEPTEYIWGDETFQEDNLPRIYVAVFPNAPCIMFGGEVIDEIRFEDQDFGYAFRGKIRIGSSLDDVLAVLAEPRETVVGERIEWKDGVLYKDGGGRKGDCYYQSAQDQVRLFFEDYKVSALYLTEEEGADRTPRRLEVRKTVAAFDDCRGKDLSRLDFSDKKGILTTLWLNQQVKWPGKEKMPPNFHPDDLFKSAMNPGLGVRQLHTRGITGKGVNVGIIDQPLRPDHPEFTGKIAAYHDVGCNSDMSMHGPAVASLLVGTQCGTAPGARLYHVAAPSWTGDTAYQAKALDWLIEQNQSLPAGQKIRVVSVSAAPSGKGSPFTKNNDMWDEACQRAEAEGILVLDCTRHHGFIGSCWIDANEPENVAKCRPGYPGRANVATSGREILVPTSARTTAEGTSTYQYTGRGGLSWAIPYTAGVLAMGWQVRPDLPAEKMKDLLLASAREIANGHRIIDPQNFIRHVQAAK